MASTSSYIANNNSRELEMALRHVAIMGGIGRRKIWQRQSMFFMSCLEFCSGFGNIWRFPWVLYKNGGGIFFIPYIIMLILVAQPVLVAESVLGQFTGLRPVEALTVIPISQGVGVSVMVACLLVGIYYSILIVYVCKYLVESMFWPLPWGTCEQWWGADEYCFDPFNFDNKQNNSSTSDNCTPSNIITEQYWRKKILHLHEDISLQNIGAVQPELVGFLLGVWTIVFLWKIRGVSRMRKMVYLSSTIPYSVLIVFFVSSHFLPGAFGGVQFIFSPQWKRLLSMEIWHAATAQLLFSLGLGLGGIIVYSSFKTFDSRIFKYVYALSIIDFVTSTVVTFSSFAVISSLAHQLGVNIEDVVRAGPGLIFIVITEGLRHIPFPNIICGFSFFMFLFFGFGSQFVLMENLLINFTDQYPLWKKRRIYVCLGLSAGSFILGIAFTTQGGILILEFMDKFVVEIALVFITFSEIFIITYIYGALRFGDDIDFMTNHQPHWFWKTTWVVTAPIGLLTSFLFGVIVLDYSTFDCEPYPAWIIVIGWLVVFVCLFPIPFCCIRKMNKFHKMPVGIRGAFTPNAAWGPPDFVTRVRYKGWRRAVYPETNDTDFQQSIGSRFGFRGTSLLPQASTVLIDGQRVALPGSNRQLRRSEHTRRLRRRQASIASVLMSVIRVPPPHQILEKNIPLHARVSHPAEDAVSSEAERRRRQAPTPSHTQSLPPSPLELRLQKTSRAYEKIARSVSWLSGKYPSNRDIDRESRRAPPPSPSSS